jgi:hypothetical protein
VNAQELYRAYRPYAVELAPKHGVELHEALHALARAAAQCPSAMEASEAAHFIRKRVRDEIIQANATGDQRNTNVA